MSSQGCQAFLQCKPENLMCHCHCGQISRLTAVAISIPESSGFFVSGWSPGETLGKRFAPEIGAVSLGDQPLTKKPEDSGIEIATAVKRDGQFFGGFIS